MKILYTTGDRFVQYQGTDMFSMKVVGVREPSEGIAVAQEMVQEGIQLIELCGGFSPVGVVAYGTESIDSMYRLFAD